MLNQKNIEAFFKLTDSAFFSTASHLCMNSFSPLSYRENFTRLVRTDGCLLLIFDVENCFIEYALSVGILIVQWQDDKVCYLTKKYKDIKLENLFPYPDIRRVIPELTIATEPTAKHFNADYTLKIGKLWKCFHQEKDAHEFFLPTHVSKSEITMDVKVSDNLFIGLMPMRLAIKDPAKPINSYLPGLLPEEKIPEPGDDLI